MADKKDKTVSQVVKEIRAKYVTARKSEAFVLFKVLEHHGIYLTRYNRNQILLMELDTVKISSILRANQRAARHEKETLATGNTEKASKRKKLFGVF